jgi:uncharacterized tellurite resistance protein B-like protein
MKTIDKNSPEALARVLAMTMITDARLDDQELDVMDRLRLYDLIGMSRLQFSRVVEAYCEEILQGGSPDGRVNLLDRARVDPIVDAVDDPEKRLLAARMVINILKADGRLEETELALFRHILERWGLSLEALVGAPAAP